MQAEFVNVFLEKQRDHLMDFVSRVIMAETKQHFTDKEIEDLTAKLTAAESHITEIEKERDSLVEQISTGEKHDAKSNATIEQLNTNISDLNGEINRLNGTINAKEQDILAKQNEINQLISDKNGLQNLVDESAITKSQMNTLSAELENANKREASMAADYFKLSADHEDLKTKYKEATTPTPKVVEVLPTPVLNKTKK
jgi:chromosome segregation ATPase